MTISIDASIKHLLHKSPPEVIPKGDRSAEPGIGLNRDKIGLLAFGRQLIAIASVVRPQIQNLLAGRE